MKAPVIFILLLTVAFTGCAVHDSVYIKDGKEYGVTEGLFRDRWWNYFERGLSYAEGEFYSNARADFQSAIHKRKNDQWRSRTYGMHFVNYFPHRELGIVYYKTGKFTQAEKELEESLATAASAKAEYYLNQSRKAILEESGADKKAPDITISYPADGMVTNSLLIELKGKAEDDHYVSSLLINNRPMLLELSSKKVLLDKKLDLKKGINAIRISATDLTGKVSELVLNVNVDRDGPVIIIEDIVKRENKIIISGYLYDSTGIESFTVNGKNVPLENMTEMLNDDLHETTVRELEFVREIELSEEMKDITISVRDSVDNDTLGEIPIRESSDYSAGISHGFNDDGSHLLAFADMSNEGSAMQYAGISDSLRKIIDNIPPRINLKGLMDIQTVFIDSIYLEGSVSDNSKIVSLLLNGKSILRREGKKIFFNYLTKLQEGENSFFIESVDAYGNRSEKMVQVTRKVPRVRTLGSRMSVSILPMQHKGEASVAGQSVSDSMLAAFVHQKRFQLIERERIDEVLQELRLSQTELVDPETASRIGKIVVADSILTGTIYETENSVEVITRLIDSETSHIMEVIDVFGEDRTLRGIKDIMEGLATKYKQSFPLIEGIVMKKDGESLLIDMGSDKNIKQDMSIIMFREGAEVRHPSTGKVLGAEPVELGEAKVETVYEKFSRAIIKKGKPAQIRIKDKIITK